jgi:hypothetical protein
MAASKVARQSAVACFVTTRAFSDEMYRLKRIYKDLGRYNVRGHSGEFARQIDLHSFCGLFSEEFNSLNHL